MVGRGYSGDISPVIGRLSTILLLLLTVNLSADGLKCFSKSTTSVSQLLIDCNILPNSNGTTFCLTKNYDDGTYALGCATVVSVGGEVNCTAQRSGRSAFNAFANYNYTCCDATQSVGCNQVKNLKIDSSASAAPVGELKCDDYIPYDAVAPGVGIRDRKCTLNAFSELQSNAGAAACVGVPEVKAGRQWNIGVKSEFDTTFLSTDQSPPACYNVAGFVPSGFCGVRRKTTKFNDQDQVLGKEFDGKYQMNLCAQSKSVALTLGNTFSLGAQDLTYENCLGLDPHPLNWLLQVGPWLFRDVQPNNMLGRVCHDTDSSFLRSDMLLTSSLPGECTTINGRFNITNEFLNRRNILPDCCVAFYHTDPAKRNLCNCGANQLSAECAPVCCCEIALNGRNPDDRCQILRNFMWIDFWLEKMVREECCNSRLPNQCTDNNGCRDNGAFGGMTAGLTSLPICCDYCHKYYDRICSYRLDDGGGINRIFSMAAPANFPFLKAFCKDIKLCKEDQPCNFGSGVSHLTPLHALVGFLCISTLVLQTTSK